MEVVLTEGTPGGGKTTRMVDEVIRLVTMEGVDPRSILVLTFTKRAQQEAVMRLSKALNIDAKELTNVRTIHSYCMAQLGIKRDQIMSPEMMLEFGTSYNYIFSPAIVEEEYDLGHRSILINTRADRFLRIYNLVRNTRVRSMDAIRRMDPDTTRGITTEDIIEFGKNYREFKRQHSLFDFTDLLELFKEPLRYPGYIFVDEGQDLTFLQWQVICSLTASLTRLYVYRDANQAIYTWGGADPFIFDRLFNKRDVNRTMLEMSYRCSAEVARVSQRILSCIPEAINPNWAHRQEVGEVKYSFHGHSWLNTALQGQKDILILVRAGYMIPEYITEVRRLGLTYIKGYADCRDYKTIRAMRLFMDLVNGEHLTRADVRSIGRWTSHKLRIPEDDSQQLTLNQVFCVAGDATDWYQHPTEVLDKLPPYDKQYMRSLLREGTDLSVTPRIRITTVHASKGAEADTVFLDCRGTPRTFRHPRSSPNFTNEAKVWYVATTRARSLLNIVRPINSHRGLMDQPSIIYGVRPTQGV